MTTVAGIVVAAATSAVAVAGSVAAAVAGNRNTRNAPRVGHRRPAHVPVSDSTDGQIESAERLRTAIAEHQAAADDGLPVNGYITDFAYIAAVVDPAVPGRTQYLVGYHAPNVPEHVAVGLFETGLSIAQSEGWNPDDDD